MAFLSIIVAGACGGLIGYAFTDLGCERGCTTAAGLVGLGTAVGAAIGVGIVAVLVLRASAEWSAIKSLGPDGPATGRSRPWRHRRP